MLDASYSARNITELFFVEALVNVTDDDLPDGINATAAAVNLTEVGVRFEAVSANGRAAGKRLETEAPDVETHCLYSSGVETIKT